ncbi:MAG: SMC-Scp complex subunit ScpB [Clostridia bacterium]|nr:SMC-Scp complex subunit ScpB [Clostridia bacterium]
MDKLDKIIESILFVAGDGVEYFDISDKLGVSVEEVEEAIEKLKSEHEKNESGIQIITYNKKAQLCSNSEYAEQVAEVLNPIKEKALTKAVLETAAIIAYKQPITRLEIEQVRGVNSDYAINNLIENKLIEVVGRKDAIGKPLLFGTTDEFLKRFTLNSLEDLPDYDELIERIQVIKTPQNAGLFDYSHMPEDNDKLEAEELAMQQAEEGAGVEPENTVVEELLNALTEDEPSEEQA